MASKIKVDQIQTADGTGTIALQNQLSGMTGASMPTGSVLQVVQGLYSTQITSTSASFSDTNLSASITPSSSSSKIYVQVINPLGLWDGASNGAYGEVLLYRDSTSLASAANLGQRYPATHFEMSRATINYLDSPSSTSSITYKTKFATSTTGAQVASCYGSNTASITLIEIAG
jgi:hypothetical protein